MRLESHVAAVNGVRLHYVSGGSGPPIIFLHGFPACWYVWHSQMLALHDTFRVIALDGRGVNLSSKPAELDAYHIDLLAQDVIALADALALETFSLVGHDWGGTLAWKVAQRFPERVTKLIVVNAPPLETLLFALATQAEQRAASAYMDRLKAPTAEAALLADDAALLWQISFAGQRQAGVYDAEDEAFYKESWQIDGALTGFLNWYRANVPAFDALTAEVYAAASVPPISVPSLLLWGEHEKAFTSQVKALIGSYVPHLTLVDMADTDHWIMLDQPTRFEALLRDFFRAS